MSKHLQLVKNNEKAAPSMVNGRVLTDDELAILKQLNKKYSHVVVGGKHQIVNKAPCAINGYKLVFSPVDSFHHNFTHCPKIAGKNQGKAWAEWPDKAFFDNGIGFYPNVKKLPKGCYNMFDGWRCEPKQGDCSFILNHITEVLCNGNQRAGNYFIQWLAHLFQHPDIKPTVAVFLKSVEGTGKGSLFRLLQKMLGVYSAQINGAELVTRNFNGILTGKLLVFADEVNLNERETFDKAKGLISEPTCQLEKKTVEVEPMLNLARFIFACNHDGQVIPAGQRERRFLLIEASDKKAGDKAYWDKFNSLINAEYAGYFLHYLLNIDLSDFDPYNAPMTKELIEQKVMNFKPLDKYLFEQLSEMEPFGGEKRTPANVLMDRFIDWLKAGEYLDEHGKKISDASAKSQLSRKLINKLGVEKHGRPDRGKGVFYEFPPTGTLREAFAETHGLTANDLFID